MRRRRRRRSLWRIFNTHMTPIIVVFAIVTVMTFTVITMIISVKGGQISDTLIEWFYKFFGLELLSLSGIKISKHVGSAFGRAEEAIDGTEEDDDA